MEQRLRILAGLGNPGKEYAGTRHNAGFLFLDYLARREGAFWAFEKKFEAETTLVRLADQPVLLVKPATFMNNSGRSVAAFLRYYRFAATQVGVVYDDINLQLGALKVSVGGGAGGHNGVRSLQSQLPDEFVRLRVGIGGRPHPDMDLADWVLSRLQQDELQQLEHLWPGLASGVECLVSRGVTHAMNLLNTRNKAS